MEENQHSEMDGFMKEAFQREDVYRFKQLVEEVAEEVKSEDAPKVISMKPESNSGFNWAALAIAASLALVVGSVFWFTGQQQSGMQLAMAELQDPHLGISRSTEELKTTEDTIKYGLSLLLIDGKHEAFLTESENALQTERLPTYENWARLYRGFAQLNAGDIENASSEFEHVSEPTELEKSQLNYYRGLMALMNDEIESANNHLNSVKEYPWSGYAKGLLKEID